MKGTIVNFRLSRTRKHDTHMIILAEGTDSREKAEKLVGKEVVYKTESGKEMKGKVAAAHGNKGAVRAIFETGMPGQAIGKVVELK